MTDGHVRMLGSLPAQTGLRDEGGGCFMHSRLTALQVDRFQSYSRSHCIVRLKRSLEDFSN